MKPLPPVKPPEKLPTVFQMTIVRNPDKQSGWFNVVVTKMQGDQVIARKVLEPESPSVDQALDDFNKYATRIFYFGEGEDFL